MMAPACVIKVFTLIRTNMAEPNIPPDQMSIILQTLTDLKISQTKLVEDNKELRDQLLNEVQIKRKRILVAEANRPTLTPRQKEFEKQYQTKNLDLRCKTKHDFQQYCLGNTFRYFNPKLLTDYPWLMFTENTGNLECVMCQMSGSGFKTDRIYDRARFLNHEFSDEHKNSIANLKQALHFRTDDTNMFEYPFNPKAQSLVQSARRASIPIEHERKRIVLDTHVKELIQGQAARGGTVCSKIMSVTILGCFAPFKLFFFFFFSIFIHFRISSVFKLFYKCGASHLTFTIRFSVLFLYFRSFSSFNVLYFFFLSHFSNFFLPISDPFHFSPFVHIIYLIPFFMWVLRTAHFIWSCQENVGCFAPHISLT